MLKSIVGITPPDSTIAKDAFTLASEACEPMLFNHVARSYYFGELLARRLGLQYDSEVLLVGTLLHDLGLTERFEGKERFEIRGANAARAFAHTHGMGETRSWLVWDAIALHTQLDFTAQKQDDVRAISIGISVDVVPVAYLEKLTAEEIAEIVMAYPRLRFKDRFARLLVNEVQPRPDTYYGGGPTGVAFHYTPHFTPPDPLKRIASAPFGE